MVNIHCFLVSPKTLISVVIPASCIMLLWLFWEYLQSYVPYMERHNNITILRFSEFARLACVKLHCDALSLPLFYSMYCFVERATGIRKPIFFCNTICASSVHEGIKKSCELVNQAEVKDRSFYRHIRWQRSLLNALHHRPKVKHAAPPLFLSHSSTSPSSITHTLSPVTDTTSFLLSLTGQTRCEILVVENYWRSRSPAA